MMSHPYQCLIHCPQASPSEGGILVGASGSCIHTFSAQNGSYLSTWPSFENTAQTQSIGQNDRNRLEAPYPKSSHEEESQRFSKRQKLSPAKDESGSSSAEIVVAGDSDNGESTSSQQPSNSPIVKLAGTSAGQHVVAVTGEDKCIRVFGLAANGTLTQLSERVMPKRPCAITLTPDDTTILCADKFGDVYSLPLVGQPYKPEAVNGFDANGTSGPSNQRQKQKPFAPSATSLTVHTKRNRDALRQQQQIKSPKAEKKALNFDHELLLGHVSLLTDVACVTLTSPSHKPRNYILTSDRDEHIRISRGIPQAHIIEGYCLGHTEFVTKLCVPPVYPHLLISGGGDGYLKLWNWPVGKILKQLDLKSLVTTLRNTHLKARNISNGSGEIMGTDELDSALNVSVSNIQALETHEEQSGHPLVEIIVTCEGVPALFMFTLGGSAHIEANTTIHTESNVIGLTVLRHLSSVVYSMDTYHLAFSTDAPADTGKQISRSLVGSLSYCTDSQTWKENRALQAKLVAATRDWADSHLHVPQAVATKGKLLTELLYGLESLRKRGSENEIDV